MKSEKNLFEKHAKKFKNHKTDIKEKFVNLLCALEVYEDKKIDCFYNENIYDLYENDKDLPILKEKMNNLIKLINNMEPDERVKFSNMDVETELWNMI